VRPPLRTAFSLGRPAFGLGRRIDARLARRGGAVELLWLPSALFAGMARVRASGYARGWLPSAHVPVPVVSVGNLSAGGTGKTPCVAFLARELQRRGLHPGILSRGYRAAGAADGENDEARMLARSLDAVERVQDPDRVRGAERLIERGVDVIVLDDGFQHRRLRRDLDLVLVDATRPWGLPAPPDGGAPVRACLPRGLLREPPGALARADALIVTRADQVAPAALERLRTELEACAPGKPLLAGVHRPARLTAPDGSALAPAALAGRTVDLVSALGNPEAFQRTVEALGATVGAHRTFPDHHAYGARDLDGLGPAVDRERWLVTSEKDAVKLDGHCAHVLGADFELVEGASVLAALLDALPVAAARRQRAARHEGLHG
jgi:tetraacyldisaccharide 4'-kinase